MNLHYEFSFEYLKYTAEEFKVRRYEYIDPGDELKMAQFLGNEFRF